MRLLLLFIALLSCGMPAAQTASLLRFFNPYSWLSYGTQTASSPRFIFTYLTSFIFSLVYEPATPNETSIRHVNTNLNKSVTDPTTSKSQLSDPMLESNSTTYQSSPVSLDSLSTTEKDADRNIGGTSFVKALVAGNIVSIPGLEIQKVSLVREIPEGREDTALQTTTETIESDPPTTKGDPTDERNPTADAKLQDNALSSSTETRDPALTVSLETTTSRLQYPSTQDQDQRLSETRASVQSSTAISSPVTVTSAAPVYVSGEERPFMTFLHADDFARYLNRNYYDKPMFHGVVGRQTE